jgi:mannose-6-phosphate isomerase-like protein (cupin superfamily)
VYEFLMGIIMDLVNIKEIQNFQDSKVFKHIPIISDQIMSTLLFIGSNTDTPPHTHKEFDEIHYIIQGNGTITVDDESRVVNEGMMILIKSSKSHNFSTMDKQMTVLTINIVPDNNQNGNKKK